MINQILLPQDGALPLPAPDTQPAGRHFRVGHWMTAPVQIVAPTTLVLDAYELMINAGIRRMPVVADGRLVGIVTLGDLREARPSRAIHLSIYEMNFLLARLTVGEVMTHNPYTVTSDAPAQAAAQIMLTHKVGGVPVVDRAGRLVGIITESDLFRLVIRNWGYLTEEEPQGAHPLAP